jgi:hypothetical protein
MTLPSSSLAPSPHHRLESHTGDKHRAFFYLPATKTLSIENKDSSELPEISLLDASHAADLQTNDRDWLILCLTGGPTLLAESGNQLLKLIRLKNSVFAAEARTKTQ